MSSSLSFSRYFLLFSCSLAFSCSIFWKYSLSCLFFSRATFLSCSISAWRRFTVEISASRLSLASFCYRSFFYNNCLSLCFFSTSIFYFNWVCFSYSRWSTSSQCATTYLWYAFASYFYSFLLISLSSFCTSSCFFISLFLSFCLSAACFCSW